MITPETDGAAVAQQSPHWNQARSRYVPQDDVNRLVNVASGLGAGQPIFDIDRDLEKPNLATLCK